MLHIVKHEDDLKKHLMTYDSPEVLNKIEGLMPTFKYHFCSYVMLHSIVMYAHELQFIQDLNHLNVTKNEK